MKTTRRLVAALAILGSAGCDGYQSYPTLEFNRTFPFDIDSQQSLVTAATLTRSQILGSLDIPDEAEVQRVDLEFAMLKLDPAAGNSATQATFGTQYDELPDPPGPTTFANNIAVGVTPGVEQNLTFAAPEAVLRFAQNVKDMLTRGSPSSISVILQTVSRTPATARLHVTGYVRVTGTITYYICAKVPAFGISSPEPSCVRGSQ